MEGIKVEKFDEVDVKPLIKVEKTEIKEEDKELGGEIFCWEGNEEIRIKEEKEDIPELIQFNITEIKEEEEEEAVLSPVNELEEDFTDGDGQENEDEEEEETNDLYECAYCGVRMTNLPNLKLHILCAHSRVKPFTCDSCPESFETEAEVREHIENVHEANRSVECPQCFKRMEKKLLVEHKLKYHAEKVIFKCSVCPRTFKQLLTFRKHLLTHFECEICQARFEKQSDLINHYMQHEFIAWQRANKVANPDKKRLFVCVFCNKVYPRKQQLKDHLDKHIETKGVYKCNHCSKIFKTQHALKVHNESHHDSRSVFKCEICWKDFKKVDLVKHLNIEHKLTNWETSNMMTTAEAVKEIQEKMESEGSTAEFQKLFPKHSQRSRKNRKTIETLVKNNVSEEQEADDNLSTIVIKEEYDMS